MKHVLQELPWKRLWLVGRPFWVSDKKLTARLHALIVLCLMGANIGLQVCNNVVAGRVAKAIQHWQLHTVTLYIVLSLCVMLLQMPVQVYYNILRTRLALIWRHWLSSSLFHHWYDASSRPYFWITTKRKDVANPDQRMSQDPESFSNSTIGLVSALIEACAQIITWASVLISLSVVLTGAAVACAVVSSVSVIVIGKALVLLTNQQMDTEAELRISAGRARDGAESIAFGHGESVAEAQAVMRVEKVIETNMSILRVTRNIQFFTTSWNMLMPLVPLGIMVYMSRGPIDYEYLVRAGGAFSAFYNAANVFATQFGGLASYFAIINRLGIFCEAVDWAGKDPQPGQHITITPGRQIVFDDVSILAPDSTRVLLSGVNFSVAQGENLLVLSSVPEAQGKTSLLRTIAGITNNGTGKIQRPLPGEVMFLTPDPDLPVGTLRQALSYPSVEEQRDDVQLLQTLNGVALAPIAVRVGGLDSVQNWREVLSKNEQQRLVLARIVLHKPKFVVVDETGLDEENDRLLYSMLAAIGAGVISAGNPATLLSFNSKVLLIAPNGVCNVVSASEYKPG